MTVKEVCESVLVIVAGIVLCLIVRFGSAAFCNILYKIGGVFAVMANMAREDKKRKD